MDNQAECFKALLAGETLIHKESGGRVYFVTGQLNRSDFNFSYYQDYEIYKEPKWYDNIPDKGTLCWISSKVADVFPSMAVGLVVKHEPDSNYAAKFELKSGARCYSARPLTKQEIQAFMDNAPESSNES